VKQFIAGLLVGIVAVVGFWWVNQNYPDFDYTPPPGGPVQFVDPHANPKTAEGWYRCYLMPRRLFVRCKNRPDPRNGQGSCVQASLAMAGAHGGNKAMEHLLERWTDPEGKVWEPVLGGSWPERVARYAKERRIPIVNVEGPMSVAAIEACLRTGRYCGITYGPAHMVCAVGMLPDASIFYIVDNNYPDEVRGVSRDTFVQEHRGYSGGWAAYLAGSSPPPWIANAGETR